MNLERIAQLVREGNDDLPGDVIMELIAAAEEEASLGVVVGQALLARREWSIRMAAVAMDRFASLPPPGGESKVADLFFELASGVVDLDDDAATQTCLNAMKRLNESERLSPRSAHDRTISLELIWRGVGSNDWGRRDSGMDALTSIHDFGDLSELLGGDGVRELRRRIHEARSGADGVLANDLESAEQLLP